METRQLIILFAAAFSIICCKPNDSQKTDEGGDDKKENVTFAFSASVSKYASLMETVTVDADNPDKATIHIDWGDGNTDSGSDVKFSHKYASPGQYTVKASVGDSVKEWGIEIGRLLALDEAVKELYKTPGKVWVMAHRSHTTDHSIPENSVKAIQAAVEAGADVVETDTHRTKDGKIVISHDESINKHTNGSGNIPDMLLRIVQSYNLTDRDGNVTSEVMPTLEEFLLAARGKVYVNLDYSPRTASTAEVLNVVESLGMIQQVFMFCKNASFVKEVFEADPKANAYVASEYWESLQDGSDQYFLQVGWNSSLSQESECVVRCRTAYDEGVLCSVNLLYVNHDYIPEYSIDDDQLASLFELYPECQMIQTDCPEILVPKLKNMNRR